ncbi:hypothetical protein TNIN_222761 [Trichonephila inaurata madagascariensis]|uniref:Uncharacterized protein n=1 Tax=Trichonephila inaurata madagascariensis TaxID=2747483 RepID=A0A8X6XUL7_9ARAC|nr:hypothetical protein TNIN_222761 [Trichonephila inaurata madagascariensis]
MLSRDTNEWRFEVDDSEEQGIQGIIGIEIKHRDIRDYECNCQSDPRVWYNDEKRHLSWNLIPNLFKSILNLKQGTLHGLATLLEHDLTIRQKQ